MTVPNLTKLTIYPINKRIASDSDFVRYMKERIPGNLVLGAGVEFTVTMLGICVPFTVAHTEPKQGFIVDETELIILIEEPLSKEGLSKAILTELMSVNDSLERLNEHIGIFLSLGEEE